jgi:hypothetical protein
MQIYAIYFHFSWVGRGSDPKNPVKIRIALQRLWIIGAATKVAPPLFAYLLGNPQIFEI